jgi:hypothetical protein
MRLTITIHDPDPETLSLILARFKATENSETSGFVFETGSDQAGAAAAPAVAVKAGRDDKHRVLSSMFGPIQNRLSAASVLSSAAPERVRYGTLLDALSKDMPKAHERWPGVRAEINAAYRRATGLDLISGNASMGFWIEQEEGELLREILGTPV